MFRALLRSMLTHRLRLVLTGLAIALGVAFMSGSFVFSATLKHSLDTLFAQASTGTDVEVLHSSPARAAVTGSAAQPVPAPVLSRVRQVPGVAAADGQISARAVLLDRAGKPLPARFSIALSWPADAPFQATFTSRSGLAPAGAGQVMIDRASAKAGHYAVGDRIEVAIGGRAAPFTISGITGYASADSIGGGSLAIFGLPTAQRLFGKAGEFDQISVKAAPGTSAAMLRDRIAAVLPPGIIAITAATASANQAQQLDSQLGILTGFFLGFAGIALFVGAFVIWNTFSIMVGQRTRELALTRALGAGRGQVFRSVLLQSLAVAAVAALTGVFGGLALSRGLAALLSSFGLSLPVTGLVVPPGSVALAFGTGIAMTLIASLAPAYRATRVAPVQAMRDVASAPDVFSGRRLAAGLAVTAAGAALMMSGLLGGAGILLTGAGAAACFTGVTALAPLVVRPLAFLASMPLLWLPGRAGVLARENTMRNPRRTSATAAALMIGLAVIVGTAVMVSSARAAVARQVGAASRTSYYVQAVNADTGITPALAAAIARRPGVQAVTEVRRTDATVAGTAHRTVCGVDPLNIARFTDLGAVTGQIGALRRGGMAVEAAVASAAGWHLGSAITVQFGSYGRYRLPVVAIFADAGPLSGYLVSNATFTADTGIRTDDVDLIRAPASARPAVRSALAGFPGAELLDQAKYIEHRTAALNTLLNLVTALLVLAIVIALLGVVNTLALSIVERTREIGLLRAIGLRRGQLRLMVAAESVIIAVIGAVLGTVLGLGLGAALAAAVTHQAAVSVPGGQLVIYILVTAAAGVLASIAPARRAARLDMLTAIAAELPPGNQASSTRGKARCRRGGMRKFCRRVAVRNRSSPLSSSATPNWCTRSSEAWLMRITRKNSAVGKNMVNCSLGWLEPSGTSMLSRPGPSIRMCMGVPSAAREERCSPDRWPIRCSPWKVLIARALLAASLAPWNTLGR
jgi:putative ABC transport system permease protein